MPQPIDEQLLHEQLPHTLRETRLPACGEKYEGKVRDTYRRGDRLVIVATDRLSAFDHVLTTVPFKGEVLNRLAAFWFARTRHVVRNHVLDVPDPNVTIARRCEPVRLEVVVRGYLTGSLWRDYQKSPKTPYGITLPAGMRKDEKFPTPLVTPSTKEAVGKHDEPISEEALLARGLADARGWQEMREAALGLFAEGQRWAASRGLILVDTKYEFGRADGELLAIDELHTPDSSRFWIADGYAERFEAGQDQRMLDKENIRQWLIQARGFQGHGTPPEIPPEVRTGLSAKYLAAYAQITGEALALRVGDVHARIEHSLLRAGVLRSDARQA